MAKRDDGWHPTLLYLDEPATEKELNELVDAGAIAFDAESNTYMTSSLTATRQPRKKWRSVDRFALRNSTAQWAVFCHIRIFLN
nr:hypothetical protein [Vibrio parahaemolyticus]